MELEKKTIHKIGGLVAFAIILYLGLNNWSVVVGALGYAYGLIFPFVLGGFIAFVINIPMTFFTKKLSNIKGKKAALIVRKWSRGISLILSCFLIVGIVALVLYLVIPQIVAAAKVLPAAIQSSLLALQDLVRSSDLLSGDAAVWINNLQVNWNSILDNAKSTLFTGAGSVITSTIGMATSLANGIVNFILGFIFSIYILLQKEKLGIQCKKVIYAFLPKAKADSVLSVLALTSQTFSNFITGQCIEAMILGLMFFVVMIILQFPYALVISVLIACTALIPVFGAFIGCAVGIFLIVMAAPAKVGWFVLIFLILQQIEGNVIYPRVVGGSVGLPSIWVLVAITIGGKAMGIVGMIIFIPLFSVAYVLFRKSVYERLKSRKLNINQ